MTEIEQCIRWAHHAQNMAKQPEVARFYVLCEDALREKQGRDAQKAYPCRGHGCYDSGNFHAGCESCPLYGEAEVALGGGDEY